MTYLRGALGVFGTWILLGGLVFSFEMSTIRFDYESPTILTYSQTNYLNNTSSVNPDNILQLDTHYNEIRTLLDITVQASPWTVFMRPKYKMVMADATPSSSWEFDEAYLSVSLSESMMLDLGKKYTQWGTGYAWHLVDVFEHQNRFLKIDETLPDIALYHYFLDEKRSISYLQFWSDPVYALRFQQVGSQMDYSAYFMSTYQQHSLGFDASKVVSNALELHLETRVYLDPELAVPVQKSPDIFVWETAYPSEIYTAYLIGGHYTTAQSVTLIFEYFYSPLGLDHNRFLDFENGVQASLNQNLYLYPTPQQQFLADTATQYTFTQFRQHYLFLRLYHPEIMERVSFALVQYLALEDRGAMVMPVLTYRVSDSLEAQLKLFWPIGPSDTEFKRFYDFFGLFQLSYFW